MKDEQLSRWMSSRRGRVSTQPESVLVGFEVIGRDPLTGLAKLDDLEQRLAACGHVGSLMLVDIADFTRLNDQQGRLVGDICLRWTAQRLAELILPADFIARAGSDEIAIHISQANTASALLSRIEILSQEPIELLGRYEVKEAVPRRRTRTEISDEPIHRITLELKTTVLHPIPRNGAVEAAYEALESRPK